MPPAAVVSDDDPTLTTTRVAAATSARACRRLVTRSRVARRRGRSSRVDLVGRGRRSSSLSSRGPRRRGSRSRRGSASPRRSRGVATAAGRVVLEPGVLARGGRAARRRPRHGWKSNTTALSASPISTASPSCAPSSRSRASTPSRLSRSARKPTASSLPKSVWRTQRSGFSPRTRQPVAGLRDGEVVRRRPRRSDHDRSGLGGRPLGARRATISAIANDSSRSPSWLAADMAKTRSPRASRSGDGRCRRGRGRRARRSCSAPPGGAGPPARRTTRAPARSRRGRRPGRGPAPSLRCRSRGPARRTARRAAGSRVRARGPRSRPRSGRGRRRP